MRPALAVSLTSLLTMGGILSLSTCAIAPWFATPLWLAAFVTCLGQPPRTNPGPLRLATALAFAWTATMLGVLVGFAGPDVGHAGVAHPAFGEHPVLVHAGLPWPGIEGNGMGLAHDRIPFAMGIDALLVDFGFWLGLAWHALRGRTAQHLATLARTAMVTALAANLFGGWHLVTLFD